MRTSLCAQLALCGASWVIKKADGHERHTVPLGRRGKPVKKLRLIPAERAHALARKLQGRFGTTVSVL